jgi:formate dehydrogenase subunit gamma
MGRPLERPPRRGDVVIDELVVDERIRRFERPTRLLHWCTAVLVLVAAVTGLVLYLGFLSGLVGRRTLVKDVHVFAGLVSPIPLVAAYAGPWRRPIRRDIRRLARWSDDDVRWLRSFGRRARDSVGKFNGGQKANAVFVAGAMTVMILTGSIMRWFEPFPLRWRTGATFVHDWTAIGLWLVLTGHIVKALSEPAALRAMVRGWMPLAWARQAHPRWVDELMRTSDGPSR